MEMASALRNWYSVPVVVGCQKSIFYTYLEGSKHSNLLLASGQLRELCDRQFLAGS